MTSLLHAVEPFPAIPLEAIVRIRLAARLVVGRLPVEAGNGQRRSLVPVS